ncbi:MAG: hypothetical protein M1823_003211 [Watsoniomyces obsoletus]|nr:MAG: hypothetical protein M1823_003211 [Watsoniomyces obsoletus]
MEDVLDKTPSSPGQSVPSKRRAESPVASSVDGTFKLVKTDQDTDMTGVNDKEATSVTQLHDAGTTTTTENVAQINHGMATMELGVPTDLSKNVPEPVTFEALQELNTHNASVADSLLRHNSQDTFIDAAQQDHTQGISAIENLQSYLSKHPSTNYSIDQEDAGSEASQDSDSNLSGTLSPIPGVDFSTAPPASDPIQLGIWVAQQIQKLENSGTTQSTNLDDAQGSTNPQLTAADYLSTDQLPTDAATAAITDEEKNRIDRDRKRVWRKNNPDKNSDIDLKARIKKAATMKFGDGDSEEKTNYITAEYELRRQERIRKQQLAQGQAVDLTGVAELFSTPGMDVQGQTDDTGMLFLNTAMVTEGQNDYGNFEGADTFQEALDPELTNPTTVTEAAPTMASELFDQVTEEGMEVNQEGHKAGKKNKKVKSKAGNGVGAGVGGGVAVGVAGGAGTGPTETTSKPVFGPPRPPPSFFEAQRPSSFGPGDGNQQSGGLAGSVPANPASNLPAAAATTGISPHAAEVWRNIGLRVSEALNSPLYRQIQAEVRRMEAEAAPPTKEEEEEFGSLGYPPGHAERYPKFNPPKK